jgi:hypothetical protein
MVVRGSAARRHRSDPELDWLRATSPFGPTKEHVRAGAGGSALDERRFGERKERGPISWEREAGLDGRFDVGPVRLGARVPLLPVVPSGDGSARGHQDRPGRRRRYIPADATGVPLMVITMPQLGETVTEGTIVHWYRAVGDEIAEDEVLFEVRATTEPRWPAPRRCRTVQRDPSADRRAHAPFPPHRRAHARRHGAGLLGHRTDPASRPRRVPCGRRVRAHVPPIHRARGPRRDRRVPARQCQHRRRRAGRTP